MRINKKIHLVIFLIQTFLIANSTSQITTTPLTTRINFVEASSIFYVKPDDCNYPSQYYDISRLTCLNCPANSLTSENSKTILQKKIGL